VYRSGLVDDVAIYDTVLTGTQIQNHYQSGIMIAVNGIDEKITTVAKADTKDAASESNSSVNAASAVEKLLAYIDQLPVVETHNTSEAKASPVAANKVIKPATTETTTMVILSEAGLRDLSHQAVWLKYPETQGQWTRGGSNPSDYNKPDSLFWVVDGEIKSWHRIDGTEQYSYETRSTQEIEGRGDKGLVKVATSTSTTAPITSEVWSYNYDSNGNVDIIVTNAGIIDYGYDALDRLTRDDQPNQNADTLTYDLNGNRTAITDGVTSTNSVYLPNSNQLDTLGSGSIGHDLAGNRISDQNGTRAFEYNNAGRLFKVYENGSLIATYTYNYQGQRTRKVTASGTTVYHYDLNGSLISETDELGAPMKDIVYRNSIPIAQIDVGLTSEFITYLHSDHLGTPRRGTDGNGIVVWNWESDAFGAAAAMMIRMVMV